MIGLFFYWLEALKGAVTVSHRWDPPALHGKITGVTVAGYELTVYCRRMVYTFCYTNWLVPPRKQFVYHVYSAITPDAPEVLKRACETAINIPVRYHWSVSEQVQQKAAVDAYLDILIADLDPSYQAVRTSA